MTERPKVTVLKTVSDASHSWVHIPLPPQASVAAITSNAASRASPLWPRRGHAGDTSARPQAPASHRARRRTTPGGNGRPQIRRRGTGTARKAAPPSGLSQRTNATGGIGRQVEIRLRDVRGPGQHRDGRSRRRRQASREWHAGQRLHVPLEKPREARQVVDLEVLQHARVLDGIRPLATRLIGRQPVQCLRYGLHAPGLSHTVGPASAKAGLLFLGPRPRGP